eukprot:TRINITY_DN2375_c0_g3_i2.p1 TRINITY_DN2375_c0_g3~~TRINITY_DN2375_c0_g3_i2.p1  ORF type:complete len:233 (+),score=30.05 TRINITY_DN2375_c0_g3_i2:105-803(+)
MTSLNSKNRRLQQQFLELKKHGKLNTSHQKLYNYRSTHSNPYSDNVRVHKLPSNSISGTEHTGKAHLRHKSSLIPIIIQSPLKSLPHTSLLSPLESKIAGFIKNDTSSRKQILNSILNKKPNNRLKSSMILESIMRVREKKHLPTIGKEKRTSLSGKLKMTAANFYNRKWHSLLKDDASNECKRPESRYDAKNLFSLLENGAVKKVEYEIPVRKMNLVKNQSQCLLLPNSWN